MFNYPHNKTFSIMRFLSILSLCVLALGFSSCDDDDDITNITPTFEAVDGALFTITNTTTDNSVVYYDRAEDGSLTLVGNYATGGVGFNINPPESPAFNDPLGVQGAVAVSPNHRYVYAVNAGSNTITAFEIQEDRLERVATVPSGGTVPVSIAATDDNVYVANNANGGSVASFTVNDDGSLTQSAAIAIGRDSILTAGGISVSQDGNFVAVTTKMDSKILIFPTGNNGVISGFRENDAAGMTPFGSAWSDDGRLFVSEAFGGDMNAGAISSYNVSSDGTTSTISASVGTNETASCWVVLTQDEDHIFTSNTPDGSISAFSIDGNGSLEAVTSNGKTGIVPNPMGSFVLDMVTVDADSDFIYVLAATNSQIVPFELNDDGSVDEMPTGVITNGNLVPGAVTGLAGF